MSKLKLNDEDCRSNFPKNMIVLVKKRIRIPFLFLPYLQLKHGMRFFLTHYYKSPLKEEINILLLLVLMF